MADDEDILPGSLDGKAGLAGQPEEVSRKAAKPQSVIDDRVVSPLVSSFLCGFAVWREILLKKAHTKSRSHEDTVFLSVLVPLW